MGEQNGKKALAGIRVLELARFVAGPYCGKLLADLGADTIKVEDPDGGDPARRYGPFPGNEPHPEKSGLFLYVNTNKRGVTANLKTAAGREAVHRLAAWADILIEDFLPREAEELELTYEKLKAVNSRLIVVSLTPFGQTGPYRNYKAYPLSTFHAGGEPMLMLLMAMGAGSPYGMRPPVLCPGFMGECDAGVSGATAALAAFYAREAGVASGQHIDISKQESAIALDRLENVLYHNREKDETKELIAAAAQGAGMVGGLLACKDGYVVMAAMQDNQWAGLVDLMGTPEWTKDEKYVSEVSRAIHAREATAKVQAWMADHTMEEVFRGGQQRGVPIGAVYAPGELMCAPQLNFRGFFSEIDHPQAGTLKYPTAPYVFSRTPWSAARSAPLLGQHNREVFIDLLGYTPEALAAVLRQGDKAKGKGDGRD